jgi:predicted esterase
MQKALIIFFVVLILGKIFFAAPKIKTDLPYQLEYRQKVFGGSNQQKLPIIIALHGAGANEKDIIDFFKQNDFEQGFRLVAFRAPLRSGFGYKWAYGQGKNAQQAKQKHDQMLQDVIDSIAGSVDEICKRYNTDQKPILFGFSRGAMVALCLAVNYPEKFSAVFAASGNLPAEFLPDNKADNFPLIYIYHGKIDQVISVSQGRDAFKKIKVLTGRVYYKEDDYGHTLPQSVVDDLKAKIDNIINKKGDIYYE